MTGRFAEVTKAGPFALKIALGKELERLRDAAGMSREPAADLLGCHVTRISHIEGGRNLLPKQDLIALCKLYGIYGTDADPGEEYLELEELRQGALQRGWWTIYRLPAWLKAYVGFETAASTLSTVGLEIIPGILQTEDYAREIHQAGPRTMHHEEITKRVGARLRRKERLTDEHPLQLSAIISEAAIRRCEGSGPVGREQLAHLANLAKLSNVTLRVHSFGGGLKATPTGPSSILTFPQVLGLADIGWQEYPVGGGVVDEPEAVAELATIHAALLDQALDEDESLALFQE